MFLVHLQQKKFTLFKIKKNHISFISLQQLNFTKNNNNKRKSNASKKFDFCHCNFIIMQPLGNLQLNSQKSFFFSKKMSLQLSQFSEKNHNFFQRNFAFYSNEIFYTNIFFFFCLLVKIISPLSHATSYFSPKNLRN